MFYCFPNEIQLPGTQSFSIFGRDGSGTWKKVRDGSGTGIPSDPGHAREVRGWFFHTDTRIKDYFGPKLFNTKCTRIVHHLRVVCYWSSNLRADTTYFWFPYICVIVWDLGSVQADQNLIIHKIHNKRFTWSTDLFVSELLQRPGHFCLAPRQNFFAFPHHHGPVFPIWFSGPSKNQARPGVQSSLWQS